MADSASATSRGSTRAAPPIGITPAGQMTTSFDRGASSATNCAAATPIASSRTTTSGWSARSSARKRGGVRGVADDVEPVVGQHVAKRPPARIPLADDHAHTALVHPRSRSDLARGRDCTKRTRALPPELPTFGVTAVRGPDLGRLDSAPDGGGQAALDGRADPVRRRHALRRQVRVGGDPEGPGAKPSDLLPLSLAACTAYDVVEILRKQRQDLRGLEAIVTSTQDEDPPWTFRAIHIEWVVTGDVDLHKAERAVDLAERTACAVAATIGPVVGSDAQRSGRARRHHRLRDWRRGWMPRRSAPASPTGPLLADGGHGNRADRRRRARRCLYGGCSTNGRRRAWRASTPPSSAPAPGSCSPTRSARTASGSTSTGSPIVWGRCAPPASRWRATAGADVGGGLDGSAGRAPAALRSRACRGGVRRLPGAGRWRWRTAGVDLLVIETQTDVRELEQAVAAARDAAPGVALARERHVHTRRPHVAGRHPGGRRRDGCSSSASTRFGVNCGEGPAQALRIARLLAPIAGAAGVPADRASERGRPDRGRRPLRLSGHPRVRRRRWFATCSTRVCPIVGGCCGTGPAHTAAIATSSAIGDRGHRSRSRHRRRPASGPGALHRRADGRWRRAIDAGELVVTVEMEPPGPSTPRSWSPPPRRCATRGRPRSTSPTRRWPRCG